MKALVTLVLWLIPLTFANELLISASNKTQARATAVQNTTAANYTIKICENWDSAEDVGCFYAVMVREHDPYGNTVISKI